MEQEKLDLLREKGFDVDGALRRFLNNKDLYKTCLKKFLLDTSFEQLLDAYAVGNCQEAFKASHTLKGLTSNLGMDCLYHILQPMVEKLRIGNMDIKEDINQLETLYKDVYEVVQDL